MVDEGAKAVRQPQILVEGILSGFRQPSQPAPPDWISGYLDYGNKFVTASPIRTFVWCSPAGCFLSRKNTLVFLQPKTVFLAFY